MARKNVWILAVVLAWAAPAAALPICDQPPAHARPDEPRSERKPNEPRDRWKWWIYDRADLKITDQQAAGIDEIFESTITRQREMRRELDRLETELSKMIEENTADVATVAQRVDKVETLRAEFNKGRTIMLYRMHRLLNPEQRAKVKELVERRDAERRRQSDSPHKR